MAMNVSTVTGNQLNIGSKRAVPGWYHVNLTDVREFFDGTGGVEVHGTVLAGKPHDSAVTDFVDSSFSFRLWNADNQKPEEEQRKSNAKQTAFLIATDLITPSQLGQPISVDEKSAIGCHAVIQLRYKQKKIQENGKDKYIDDPDGWLDLAFADFLHIDDPAVVNVPKNIAALKFVPAARRHADPKYFAFKAKPSAAAAGGGNAVGGSSHAAAGSPAGAGGVAAF